MIDVEDLVKAWLLSLGVVDKVFLAVPKGDPVPCVTLRRAGGGLQNASEMLVHAGRVSISVWAGTRSQAKTITAAIVENIHTLDRFVNGGASLQQGAVQSVDWFPDPVSDRPRYIVDGLFHATAA